MSFLITPRTTVILLLLAGLFIGIAQTTLMPPLEGTDESAHYSYIQQLAETNQPPRRGDKMSKDIDDYLKVAPTGMDRQRPYANFFARGADAIETGRVAAHGLPRHPRKWQAGTIENWQSQHPPLYYMVMTPLYRVSNGWSFGDQILLLRMASYLLAWGALALVSMMALRTCEVNGTTAALPLAVALWPMLFPMWFPEMARIGNDSLAIAIVAGIAAAMAALVSSASIALYALLALLLGLGLLTKAILIPVAAAALLVLALLTFAVRDDRALLHRRLVGLVVLVVMTAMICGWWYVLKFIETGNAVGSHDIVQMNAAGGLFAGLKQHFVMFDLLRAPWGWLMTFLWGSTWSYIIPPRALMIGLATAALVLGFGCCRELLGRPLTSRHWLALLTLAFFVASIAYHTAVVISFDGGISPMWYLHAVAPILAPLVAAGFAGLRPLRFGRGILAVVIGYPLAFLALANAVNALYYAGCGGPTDGGVYFVVSTARECAGNFPATYANLSVLSYPGMSAVMFSTGWLLYAAGATLAWRHLVRATANEA